MIDTQDGKVLDELSNIRGEVLSTGGTSQDVCRPQIHQTALTKCMAALENARNFIFVVVGVETNWANNIHRLEEVLVKLINSNLNAFSLFNIII